MRRQTKQSAEVALRQYFGNYPIVEAKAGVSFLVSDEDISLGIPKSQTECAIVQSAKRQIGARKGVVQKTIAYFLMPNSKGEPCITRFEVPDHTRKVLSAFDRNKAKTRGGVLVTFRAVRRAATLKYSRDRHRKLRHGLDVHGHKKKPGRRTGQKLHIDTSVRNGSGGIHNLASAQ